MLWRNSGDSALAQKPVIAEDKKLQRKQCLACNLSVTAASSIRGCMSGMPFGYSAPSRRAFLRFKMVATRRERAYPGTSKILRNQAASEARRP